MIRIMKYGETPNGEIFARSMPTVNVTETVAEILKQVRERGDEALREYTAKFDHAELESLLVSQEEMDEAMARIEPEFLAVLEKAAANIRKFHQRQVRNSFIINDEPGIVMGQKVIPVDRAGLYVPCGTAAYPSAVLMDAIPAKIAGCREVVMTTPPGPDGKVNPAILAAAHVAGVDRIFKVGGAQAIAALAYGTETVPAVDKIVGPGNAFVAEAKKQVYGQVSIDMIAGPSEILIVADEGMQPDILAADLLSQAEHDKMASAVLVTDSRSLAEAGAGRDRKAASRCLTVRKSPGPPLTITERSLWLNLCRRPSKSRMKSRRSILSSVWTIPLTIWTAFVTRGPSSWEGTVRRRWAIISRDRITRCRLSGTAKFSSPLSVDDFVKKTQYTYFTRDALARVART